MECKIGQHEPASVCQDCPEKDKCPAEETSYDRVKAERNSYQEPFCGN